MIDQDETMTSDGPASPPPKRLRRSNDERVAGVCGGIAEYFDLDPTIVRIAFVILALIGFGTGVLAYGVMWLVMPDGDDETALAAVSESVRSEPSKRKVAAIVIGGLILVAAADGIANIRGGLLLPMVLVAGGIALIVGRDGNKATEAPSPAAPPTPGPTPGGNEAGMASFDHLATEAAVEDAPTGNLPVVSQTPPPPPPQYSRPVGFGHDPSPAPNTTAPKPPSVITPVVLSLMVLAAGVILILDRAGAIDASLVMVGAVWLLMVGAGLLVSTVRGKATGLIFVGLLVAMLTMVGRWVDPIIDDGAGERSVAVFSAVELESEYRLGAGELRVDLSGLDLDGETRQVDIHLGIGELKVYIPDDLGIELQVQNDIGNVDFVDRLDRRADRNRAGIDNSLDLDLLGTGVEGSGSLVMNVSSGIGNLEVIRVP